LTDGLPTRAVQAITSRFGLAWYDSVKKVAPKGSIAKFERTNWDLLLAN
jgi:hypothetical protein